MGIRVEKNNLNRKVFALNDFRGVDYASSPLEVKPYRATDMANLLLRDGMLKKRHGFRQVYKLTGVKDDNNYKRDVKVHKTADDRYVILQVAEREFLETPNMVTSSFYLLHKEHNNNYLDVGVTSSLNAAICTSVIVGLDTYFYGDRSGEIILKFNYIAKKFEQIMDFYIPTTTINIPFMQLSNDMDDETSTRALITDKFVAYPYTSNESANMLTNVVRNKFLARPGAFLDDDIEQGRAFFKLDGKIPKVFEKGFYGVYPDPVLKIETADGEKLITFKVSYAENYIDKDSYGNPVVFLSDAYCWYSAEAGLALYRDNRAGEYYGAESNYSVLLKVDDYKFKKFLAEAKSKGYADDKGVEYKEFILEYPNENLGDTQADVLMSNNATIFGVDGANDRIFLSGSSGSYGGKGNIVYISENDVNLKPNPTYFPVDSFIACGNASSNISGFMRVTDGRLAIFKDITDVENASVYYTSGYYVDHTDTEIGTTYQEARFTVQAGDISRNGISARAIANLDGDNIFTSKEGVYGIQLSSNVASGERYARERSRTINPKIAKKDLQNSKGIVFEDKYFLAVGDGEVYVADARYKFSLQGDQQNTFNYEWFRLTGLYVKEWFTIDGTLHFIDEDGYICEFTEGYADEYMRESSQNELSVKNGVVTFVDTDLDLVKASAYAIDHNGRTWELKLTEDEKAIVVPGDITITDGSYLILWFCKPIDAYWQSSVLSLETAMVRKNMWSMSMTVNAEQGGRVDLGYKTRFTHKDNVAVQGVNEGFFDDVNFIGGISFDNGGYLGINTYRFRVFERGFTHMQVLFSSATTTDCAVCEIDIEYSTTIKNIGVG